LENTEISVSLFKISFILIWIEPTKFFQIFQIKSFIKQVIDEKEIEKS
jgi:hypothetical protein